jgi:1-phosphatidylinositol-4-phosphate 5-kinase
MDEMEKTPTDDSEAAVHPNMMSCSFENSESSPLPLPLPPPRHLSLPPHSNSSPKGTKTLFNLPQGSPTREPVGLTLNIDLSSPHSPNGQLQLSPKRSVQHAGISLPVDSPGLEIEEGTPAAEALRANADVKVTKVGKVARYLQVQAVRKTAKNVFHVGSGAKRGKPPRVPDLTEDEFRNDQGHLDVLLESDNEDEVPAEIEEKLSPQGQGQGQIDEDELIKIAHDAETPILMAKSSDSSDGGVPTKVASFHKAQKLTLLDTKGKKREVRLDRKMKRKMKKREKKKAKRNYVKGKVIDGHHELYTLSIAMMLGLRYSIFLTNNQLVEDKKDDRMWLDSDEFMKVEKYIFRPDGRNNTPPHQLTHTFKFKDYSPLPFAFIRRMFGINEYEFHHSVCGNANFIEFISNAKSGQFFFYSSDGRYMIKTMTNQESKFLRRSKFYNN